MWERFSFYGMQGILLLYMYYSLEQGGLGMPEAVATGIVGAYGGAVYLSTILGAWVADRLLGSERVLFYSAIVIMAGHIALAVVPGFWGLGAGLILVAVGSGGLKANATSVVGTLYAPADTRRDAGFSLFYLGINLGALLGPILTGWAMVTWGFHAGFALAAIGMAAGLIQYSIGRKNLPDEARAIPNPLPVNRRMLMIGIAVAAIVARRGARAVRHHPRRQSRGRRHPGHARRDDRVLRGDPRQQAHRRRPSARACSGSSRCSS